jgi:hypothetical protein
MKRCSYWHIMPCSPLNGNRRFGGTFRLDLQEFTTRSSRIYDTLLKWRVRGGHEAFIYWDVTLCTPLNGNRRFKGTFRLHLQEFTTFYWNVGSEMDMKRCIYWDVTPCGPLKGNRRFGGTFYLHLQEFTTFYGNVGSEVPTAVGIKPCIYWDITACSPLKGRQTFRMKISPPSSGM